MNDSSTPASPEEELYAPELVKVEGRPLTKTLMRALGVSSLIHLAFFGTLWVGILMNLPFVIEFEESAGIGMIQQLGRLHEGEFAETAPRYTNVSLDLPAQSSPDEEQEEPAPSEEELAAAEEAARQAAEAQAAEQARVDQAAREAEEAEARAERRRQRREKERLAERQAAADAEARAAAEAAAAAEAEAAAAASTEEAPAPSDVAEEAKPPAESNPAEATPDGYAEGTGAPDAGPNMDLPPGERYPAGTINPIATDLGMWGPEGARLVVVLRNDRLRSSPHAETATSVLSSFPDWRRLVGGAEMNPLEDLDTVVIASSDPRYINRTFLVATHHMPAERVVATLSSGDHESITWEEDRGRLIGRPKPKDTIDPRVFFVPTEKVFAFTRPEYMDALRGDMPRVRNLDGALETARAVNQRGSEVADARIAQALVADERVSALRPSDEPPLRDQGWLSGLMKVGDYGGTGRQGPAIMVSTGTIAGMRIQGYRGVMPQGFHANVFAERDARITARAIFSDRAEAESFKNAWQGILDANRSALTVTGLYRALSEAKLSVDHNETIIEFTVANATVRRLGVTVSQLMESR